MHAVLYLPELPTRTLEDLGRALRAGRLGQPATALAIKHVVPNVTGLAAEELAHLEMGSGQCMRHCCSSRWPHNE